MKKKLIKWALLLKTSLLADNQSKLKIIGATLGTFIFANLLFSGLPLRLDLSANKIYTLSSSSKKIVKNLKKKAEISLFISSDLPLQLAPLKTDIINLVNEYDRLGGSNVTVTVKDPKKDATAKKVADSFGIPELPFSQIEQDKYAISNGYLGMAITYDKKNAVIPQAVNPSSLEYDITAGIYKLTQEKSVSVGIIGDAATGPGSGEQYSSLKSVLSQQFDLQAVNIASGSATTLSPELSTVILIDNGQAFTNQAKTILKQYLDRGSSVILLIDGESVDDNLAATSAKHNLFDLVASYGMTLNRDSVLSNMNEVARFNTPSGLVFTQYPFWVKTIAFDKKRPEFGNISQLLFPWVSSVKINDPQKAMALVNTSSQSWHKTGLTNLYPQGIVPPTSKELSTHNLIVEAKTGHGGRLLLIPSSRFIHDGFLGNRNDNLEFVLNMVNTYASRGALSGIRSRAVDFAPLKPVDEKNKDWIKYFNIVIFPGMYGLLGVYRLFRRREYAKNH